MRLVRQAIRLAADMAARRRSPVSGVFRSVAPAQRSSPKAVLRPRFCDRATTEIPRRAVSGHQLGVRPSRVHRWPARDVKAGQGSGKELHGFGERVPTEKVAFRVLLMECQAGRRVRELRQSR